jgi:hypothetical protein
MIRSARLRWMALGVVVGVLLVVAAIVVGILLEPRDVDADDATKVADRWAADHRRPGETYQSNGCGTDAGGYRFVCHVRFEPTRRRFTLFMRKTAAGGYYSVVLTHVQRGTHPLPDFPNTIQPERSG